MKKYAMPDRYITYRDDGFTIHTPIMPYHTHYRFRSMGLNWTACRVGDEALYCAPDTGIWAEIKYYARRPAEFIPDIIARIRGEEP